MPTWLAAEFLSFLAPGCGHETKSSMMGSEWQCCVHFLDQVFRKEVFVLLFCFPIGWKILAPGTASWTINGSHVVETLMPTHPGSFAPISSMREKLLSY